MGLGRQGSSSCFWFVVSAGVFEVAAGALVPIFADAASGGQFFAFVGEVDGFDASEGEDVGFSFDVLRGNLQA